MKTGTINFGEGTKAEIREAIAKKSVNEDRYIKQFTPASLEYAKLQAAAELLTLYSSDSYEVNDTYFDYGQNWVWTTISMDSNNGKIQALTPKEQGDILDAGSPAELGRACDAILKHLSSYNS